MSTDTIVYVVGALVIVLTVFALFKFFRAEKEEHPSITDLGRHETPKEERTE
jgi:hypothetical protein